MAAGLLGALVGGGGFTGKFIDKSIGAIESGKDRQRDVDIQKLINSGNLDQQGLKNKGAIDIQNLINSGNLEQIKEVGGNQKQLKQMDIDGQLKLLRENFGQQDKWTNRGINSFEKAGLPEFAFWDRGGGGLNLGSTRDYLGGNNSVSSFGTGLRLPKTGTSPYADMNNLSRPDISAFGR